MAIVIDGGVEVVLAWVGICLIVFGGRRVRRLRARRCYRRLVAAINEGDSERAFALWEAFVRLYPNQSQSAELRYHAAVVLALREDWQAALTICSEPGSPKNGAAQIAALRARCLAELGRGDEAMAVVDATQALTSVAPAAQATLQVTTAIVQVSRGEYLQALRTLEAVAPIKGAGAACSFHRGEALRALGRYDEACAAYKRTIELAPLSRRAGHARQRLALPPPSSYR